MIKEVRKIKARGKAMYIRSLMWRKNIETHISENGYVAYDTEELKNYQKNCKRGRPIKKGE